jgi:CHAD domain-containing protein
VHVCHHVRTVTITEVAISTLREHVRSHTATLLRRMAFQVRQAMLRADADDVHDLRVSIRRLRECLRTFARIYPAAPRRKIRKELRKLMKSAERVRSTDIALDLLSGAGLAETEPLVHQLREQRTRHRAQLHEELAILAGHPYTKAWREALGL